MARPKSFDPAERLTLSFPGSIRRLVMRTARSRRLTTSAFMLELIREHFKHIAEALNMTRGPE